MFCLPSLGNGWSDCVEIWYALGDPLVTAYAAVTGGAAAVVFFCLMSVYLVYSVIGGALIQALCASAPLFYYFFVLFMLYTDIIHLFAMFIRLINIVMMMMMIISARAHVQTALLYLRNGSADWVQFWCVSWGS